MDADINVRIISLHSMCLCLSPPLSVCEEKCSQRLLFTTLSFSFFFFNLFDLFFLIFCCSLRFGCRMPDNGLRASVYVQDDNKIGGNKYHFISYNFFSPFCTLLDALCDRESVTLSGKYERARANISRYIKWLDLWLDFFKCSFFRSSRS